LTEFSVDKYNRGGKPISHMKNLGKTMVRNLKKYGLVFKETENQ